MIGIAAFILTLLVLVLVHEFGHFAAARFLGVGVEEFGIGFPPVAYKRKVGKTIVSLNWLPLGGFVRIKGEEESDGDPDSFTSQSVGRRAVIIVAGVIMNLIVAAILFTIGFTVGMPQDISGGAPEGATVSNVEHHIVGVLPNSPAADALRPGDIISKIDGITFLTLSDLQDYISARANMEIDVSIKRDEEVLSLFLKPERLVLEDLPEPIYGLGVRLMTTGEVAYPWYRAPIEGTRVTADTFGIIGATLWRAGANFFRGQGAGIDIAGPIGIAVITNDVVALGGIFFLQFIALLSVNLAFINLVPIPALDGGRLLFIIIEAARRRPVSRELEMKFHRLGFTFLLFLVVVVTYIDLRRFDDVFGSLWDNFRQLIS